MDKFKLIETAIKDLVVIETRVFKDERGFFIESYNYREFEKYGINVQFVQDNHSHSKKGVLRGLHFQLKYPQGKLVRVVKGRVFDVAVDLRKNSSTFKKWFGVELSSDNNLQLYIPPCFAHGFLTLEEGTDFFYKCNDYYRPEDEMGIIWNDRTIGINWPLESVERLIISEKDHNLPELEEVIKFL
jgi:dTDP-4-dehydrorhamnose 3,5-epimerase